MSKQGSGAAWFAGCVCLLAMTLPTHQSEPVNEALAVGEAQRPDPDTEKRAWSDLQAGWGKRGWQDLQSGWGKRAWSDLGSTWGKRDWGSFRGAWGKRAWDDLRPMWGKRNWDSFHGSWGKRWAGDDMSDEEPLSDEQVAQLASLLLSIHSEPYSPSLVGLTDDEQKRSWSNLRGAWGKRSANNYKVAGGRKREPGWNNLKGLWGKRSTNSWNRLASVWGKRSIDGDVGMKEDATVREN